MAAIRLTNRIRSSILKQLISDRFDKDDKELKLRECRLALEVYHDNYSVDELELMDKFPEGAFHRMREIGVQFGACYTYLKCVVPGKEKETTLRIFAKHQHTVMKVYPVSHKLTKAYEKLSNDRKALKEQRRDAEYKAQAVLDSASTMGKLKSIWPEIEPYLKKFETTPAGLPSVPVEAVNRILGLPRS